MRLLKLAFLLPSLHLAACLVTMLGLWLPSLQFLGIGWSFIMLADLPVSLVAYFVGWKYSSLAVLWIFVAGTVWWYLLGRIAQGVFGRDRHTEQLTGVGQSGS